MLPFFPNTAGGNISFLVIDLNFFWNNTVNRMMESLKLR